MRDHKVLSVRTVVAIGIGTAILFILKRFAVIPTGIANTNIDISYGFLGFIATLFGPIAGFFIGFLGHALNDFTQYGQPWWTWVFTTGLVGFVIGLFWRRFNVKRHNFFRTKIAGFNVKPPLDIIIYSEPANKVYVQGIVSAISNSIATGVIGTILLVAYAATRTRSGSLKKES